MVFDAQGGYRRMQLRIRGAGFAVYRSGVYEIGLIGLMSSRIDMPILCGRDICVLATMFGNIPCDAFGHGVTACYAEFAAFAKSGLHIHHD